MRKYTRVARGQDGGEVNSIIDLVWSGGFWVHWLGARGARGCVIVLLREYICNAIVLLVFPTFDDTGSLGYPPRRVVYHPSVSPPGDCLPFPCSE